MATLAKTFAVALTIPDNEAFTARETLQRLGLAVGEVRRAAIWTFEVEAGAAAALAATIATIETIFNPNKHELVERGAPRPVRGEVWITARDAVPVSNIGGRALAGVRRIERSTAWTLLDARGSIVPSDVLDRAVATFLCNPAFQKAIR